MRLSFIKMHGLGNDFVMIEDLDENIVLSPENVRFLCDRNFGVGADGVILIRPALTPDGDFFMLYYNADGTTAEMCGNGIRCFAKFVVDQGLIPVDRQELAVDTLGGLKHIRVTRDDEGSMREATVNMGPPALRPADIPVDVDGEQVFECPFETSQGTFNITAVSMGNPHAIIWVDDVDTAPVHSVGPLIENDPRFPAKTNVEFAQYMGDQSIRLRVWERGVGETLACGTGACATAVAGSLSCIIGRTATIELPGGSLNIRWDESGDVFMTGPAATVFTGSIELPQL